jgi:hypothetical protein
MPCCSNLDWDDVLAYTTYKRVAIRHKYVGGCYYFAWLCILAYTIVYQVFILQGYRVLAPVVGATRATVEPARQSMSVSEVHYCVGSQFPIPDGVQLPCLSFEPLIESTQTPDIGLLVGTRLSTTVELRSRARDSSVAVAVAVARSLQRFRTVLIRRGSAPLCREATCELYKFGCAPWVSTYHGRVDSFIGDIDNATIFMQHSAQSAGSYGPTLPGSNFIDSFDSTHQRTVKLVGPGTPSAGLDVTPGNGGDIVTLHALVSAAGLDLDANMAHPTSEETPFPDNATTARYSGTTIRVNIEYNNGEYPPPALPSPLASSRSALEAPGLRSGALVWHHVSSTPPARLRSASRVHLLAAGYTYRLKDALVHSKRQSIRWDNGTHRMVDDIHGIQFIFTQVSGVYKFDIRTLLLTLVSGLALLASAKTVADSPTCTASNRAARLANARASVRIAERSLRRRPARASPLAAAVFLLYVAPRKATYKLFAYDPCPDLDPDTPDEQRILPLIIADKKAVVDLMDGEKVAVDRFLREREKNGERERSINHSTNGLEAATDPATVDPNYPTMARADYPTMGGVSTGTRVRVADASAPMAQGLLHNQQ